MHKPYHDVKIIDGIVGKDERVLKEFYDSYNGKLFRFVYTQIRQKEIAEDLVQDILVDSIEQMRDFKRQCSLKTYVFTIARNKVIDHIRKKKIKQHVFSSLPFSIVEQASHVVMDETMDKQELSHKIDEVLERLPNDYRVVIRLKYMKGYRVRRIAEKLAMSFKATESMIFRARSAFARIYHSL